MRLESAALRARLPPPQPLKLDPLSPSSVRPLAFALRDWSTWKTPAVNLPDWVLPALLRAAVSFTVPRVVSRIERTGTVRASVSGTKPPPCAALPLVRADPAGSLTNTLPFTTSDRHPLAEPRVGPEELPKPEDAEDRGGRQVEHVEVALRAEDDRRRGERAVSGLVARVAREEGPAGGELRDPAVGAFGDPDVARRVHRHVLDRVQLPGAGAGRADHLEEAAGRGELLDAGVAAVGDEDVGRRVERQAERPGELAGRGCRARPSR